MGSGEGKGDGLTAGTSKVRLNFSLCRTIPLNCSSSNRVRRVRETLRSEFVIPFLVGERKTVHRLVVVPIKLDWSDVGSWAAVYDLADKDSEGNVVDSRSFAIGTRGSLIRSQGPRIVTIGVENLIVVATGDYVLVAPLSEAQRVREAAELMNPR